VLTAIYASLSYSTLHEHNSEDIILIAVICLSPFRARMFLRTFLYWIVIYRLITVYSMPLFNSSDYTVPKIRWFGNREKIKLFLYKPAIPRAWRCSPTHSWHQMHVCPYHDSSVVQPVVWCRKRMRKAKIVDFRDLRISQQGCWKFVFRGTSPWRLVNFELLFKYVAASIFRVKQFETDFPEDMQLIWSIIPGYPWRAKKGN